MFVDSNLLLLYLVGTYDRPLVTSFKRTADYSPHQFDCLAQFLSHFDKIITTPQVLTEISNLSGKLPEPTRTNYFAHLARLIPRIFDERYVHSSAIATDGAFIPFGLTDAGVAVVCSAKIPVLTDDGRLAAHLLSRGVYVVFYNVIQDLYDR